MGNNYGKKKGKTYINTQDIVGLCFGPYKVEKYNGVQYVKTKTRKYGSPIHKYEVKCIECGYKAERVRGQIIRCVGEDCPLCSMRKTIDKKIETKRKNIEPNRNNKSTGIKRYSISKKRDKYIHTVECFVERKRYKFMSKISESREPDEEFIKMAEKINDVLSKGTENFHSWYEKTYENTGQSIDTKGGA